MSNEVGKAMKTCKYLDHWKNLHFCITCAPCSGYVEMIVDSDSSNL
jgi:hypothetical protein